MALRLIGLMAFVAVLCAGVGIEIRSTFMQVSTPCTEAFAGVASVDDTEEAIEDLYPAVRACTSMDE